MKFFTVHFPLGRSILSVFSRQDRVIQLTPAVGVVHRSRFEQIQVGSFIFGGKCCTESESESDLFA